MIARLERWYWCGVFGELYGSATETRMAQDIGDVATVLRELAEDLSVEGLRVALADSPTSWGQRLGYLLGHVGADSAAAGVSAALATPHWTLLDPRAPRDGARDTRWRIVVNTAVEADQ